MSCSKMIATKLRGVGDKFATVSRHPWWLYDYFARNFVALNFWTCSKFLRLLCATWRHMRGNYESLATVSRLLCDPLTMSITSCRKTVAVQWDRGFIEIDNESIESRIVVHVMNTVVAAAIWHYKKAIRISGTKTKQGPSIPFADPGNFARGGSLPDC